jgi:uncharacterized protein (TIGR00375 family)
VIGTEVASIKKHAGETRRVHHLIFAPSLETAAAFTRALESAGCNVRSDGRPILGLTSKQLLEMMLEIDERMMMVPAHAWTPWFGIFGAHGGYDTLGECFEELTDRVFAIETGLSSDPLMNWRVPMLDHITLISNSDAHSTAKLGREANVMQFESAEVVTYSEIRRILATGDRERFLYTIEFFPEEGKYHLDGHRACQVVCTPEETKKLQGLCPKCHKPLTVGVMHRVDTLAGRGEAEARKLSRIPYRSLVPLPEIIADTFGCGVATKKVQSVYDELTKKLGSEFSILLHTPLAEIAQASSPQIARAIERVRQGNIVIRPGYDGEFGVVKVFEDAHDRGAPEQVQLSLD